MTSTNVFCSLCKTPNPPSVSVCKGCGEPVAGGHDSRIGSLINNRYRIIRQLGVGGMGVVYLSQQESLGRDCVLKLLNKGVTDDPSNAKRFKREAEMAAKVWHPNAVQIYDYDILADGSAYIAMEFIDGRPLSRVIKDEYPFDPKRIVSILGQLCDVLAVGHSLQMVHRDLKPDNIMLKDLPTKRDFVKLLDFGLAKQVDSLQPGADITQAGFALGTPKFMAPEQCRGQKVGPAADLYAMGVILYLMLAGSPPFEAKNVAALMVKHTSEPPVPPSRRGGAGSVHPELEKLALWALAKNVEERVPSASEFKRRLDAVVAVSTASSTVTPFGHLGDLLGDTIDVLASEAHVDTKEVTLVVLDLVGMASTWSADRRRALMARLADQSVEWGGGVQELAEYRLLVHFGIKRQVGEDVESAMSFCRQVVGGYPTLSAAIHRGPVDIQAGNVNINDTIDSVERIAMAVPVGQVIITEDALGRRDRSGLRPAAPYVFKGGKESVRIFEIEFEPMAQDELPQTVTEKSLPAIALQAVDTLAQWKTIGCDDLYKRLDSYVHTAQAGTGSALLIQGQSGLGKSRAVLEVMDRNPELLWIYISSRDPKALKRLARKLLKLDVPLEHRVGLKWLLEMDQSESKNFSAEDFSRSVVSSIVFSIRALNERKPVGVIIEDIEESNAILKLVLSSLLDDAVHEKLLTIMTSRPGGNFPQGIKRFVLEPLEGDSVMRLAKQVFPAANQYIDVFRIAGGVPGAIVRLATTVKQMSASDLDISLRSPNLKSIFETWLDGLEQEVRNAVSICAAIDFQFERDVADKVLKGLLGRDGMVEDLMEFGLLEPQPFGSEVHFSSEMERQVALARLPHKIKDRIYRQIAVVLEESFEDEEKTADFYRLAGDLTSCLRLLRRAAATVSPNRERVRALKLFQKVYDVSIKQSESGNAFAEDVIRLLRLLIDAGKLSDARSVIQEVDERGLTETDARFMIQYDLERLRLFCETKEFELAQTWVQKIIERGKELRDPIAIAETLRISSEIASKRSQSKNAIMYLRKGLEVLGAHPGDESRRRAVGLLGALGRLLIRTKEYDQALMVVRQQRDAARRVDDSVEEGRALINEANILQAQENYDQARQILEMAIQVLRRAGDMLNVARGLYNLGHILNLESKLSDSFNAFRDCLELARAIRWKEGVASAQSRINDLSTKLTRERDS